MNSASRIYKLLLFIGLFLIQPATISAEDVDNLLNRLDSVIANRGKYEQIKIDNISGMRSQLSNKNMSNERKYLLNSQLYLEYESYVCDSALHYIEESIKYAKLANNKEWIDECNLRKIFLLSISGLYSEAHNELNTIDKNTLSYENRITYYSRYENLFLYKSEFSMGNEYAEQYLDLSNSYRDSILRYANKESSEYILVKGPVLIAQKKYDEAIDYIHSELNKMQIGNRQYSILASILAYAYDNKMDSLNRKKYLILSTISDILGVVKENNSMRCLAEIFYTEGKVERANQYMKISIEDATKYNARLRNIQATQMFSLIDTTYQKEIQKQQKSKNILLYIVSVLSILLLISMAYVKKQMRKLSLAHRNLKSANKQLNILNEELLATTAQQEHANNMLTESNYIKEEYIGRFLELCSNYIDNIESYRRRLNKKASTGKIEDLYNELRSTQFIEDEMKKFQINFDNSFLRIFPHFVNDFNALFPEDKRIYPKNNEKLTTEHRIFALIRLGIVDSGKIASFLHYSITTIYTYRSKLKNRSLYPEDFEARVSKIRSS